MRSDKEFRLRLAQAEGQGIPTIVRTMREEGRPPPVFQTDPQSVVCVLPAHPKVRRGGT
jgi:predicted HTH transcriptional regulator